MKSYEELLEIIGTSDVKAAKERLQSVGLRLQPKDSYVMAYMAEEDPDFQNQLDPSLRELLPGQIEMMKNWENAIVAAFTSEKTTHVTMDQMAMNAIANIVMEAGRQIVFHVSNAGDVTVTAEFTDLQFDPFTMVGVKTICKLDDSFSLADLLSLLRA